MSCVTTLSTKACRQKTMAKLCFSNQTFLLFAVRRRGANLPKKVRLSTSGQCSSINFNRIGRRNDGTQWSWPLTDKPRAFDLFHHCTTTCEFRNRSFHRFGFWRPSLSLERPLSSRLGRQSTRLFPHVQWSRPSARRTTPKQVRHNESWTLQDPELPSSYRIDKSEWIPYQASFLIAIERTTEPHRSYRRGLKPKVIVARIVLSLVSDSWNQ